MKIKRLFQHCCLAALWATSPAVVFADWYAMAHSVDSYAVSVEKPSKAAALADALAKCKSISKEKCKADGAVNDADDPVIARSPAVSVAGSENGVYMGLSNDLPGAIAEASKHCRARLSPGQQCEILYNWRSLKGVTSDIAQNGRGNDCRPKTEVLRCTSQCSNGNCTVKYENGCTIQIQVRPVFNGFRNEWEYPSPSC